MWFGSALNDSSIEAQTGENGAFELRCVRGSLNSSVAVTLLGDVRIFIREIKIDVVQSSGELTVQDIELPDFVWVHGTLKDSRGEPAPQVEISHGTDPTRRTST